MRKHLYRLTLTATWAAYRSHAAEDATCFWAEISAEGFLGEEEWSGTLAQAVLALTERLDDALLPKVVPAAYHPLRLETLALWVWDTLRAGEAFPDEADPGCSFWLDAVRLWSDDAMAVEITRGHALASQALAEEERRPRWLGVRRS